MLARVRVACKALASTSLLGPGVVGSEAAVLLPDTLRDSLLRSFTASVPASAKASPLPICTGRPRLVVLGSGWGGARCLLLQAEAACMQEGNVGKTEKAVAALQARQRYRP